MRSFPRISALVLIGATVGACSGQTGSSLVSDPLEPLNREIHAFNKGVDTVLLRPGGVTYDAVTPLLVKHLVRNAVSHASLPGVFVNHLLQGRGDDAATTLGRFAVNTLVGAGGVLDPATEFELPLVDTDFGLTLATWGVDEGPYVELPLLGPSTLRDAVAVPVDMALTPTTYAPTESAITIVSTTGTLLDLVDSRNRATATIDELLYNSEDSYISLRTAYIQNRRRQVAGGDTATDDLPDLFGE